MKTVTIIKGAYGHRVAPFRVRTIPLGSSVELPDAEAERLIALGVAAIQGNPVHVAEPVQETQTADGGESAKDSVPAAVPVDPDPDPDPPDEAEVAKLEKLSRADLERMAKDLGVDISAAKTKHDCAVLLAAADADNEEAAPDLDAADIVS